MKRTTASQIAKYLQQLATRPKSGFSIRRIGGGKPLESFHQWVDGKRLIAAHDIKRYDGESLVFLLIEWRRNGHWYLAVCESTTHHPLAEVWRESRVDDLVSLDWTYKPAKRDGRNSERTDYFRTHVGDLTMRLAVPSADEDDARFVDDVFTLVDNRLRADDLAEEEPEAGRSFPEGGAVERIHTLRERNSEVIRLAKSLASKRGPLSCQICGFDFHRRYGRAGQGYIEAHHTIPVSELMEGAETRVEDIALVCANCHRMLHRRRPWLTMGELKSLLTDA